MAIELSFDGKRQRTHIDGQQTGKVAAWVGAQCMAMIRRLGRVAAQTAAKIRVARTHGGKRKQMKLVESLALGNRRQLLLVVCNNRRYLVGAGAESVGSILAVDAEPASRDRSARGPELVRRRGRDANQETPSKAAIETGLDLWP